MINRINYFFFLWANALISCNFLSIEPPKMQEGLVDELIFEGKRFSDATFCKMENLRSGQLYFDPQQYSKIDSIKFQIGLRTPIANNYARAYLFNLTDSVPLSESMVQAEIPYQLNQLYSQNLLYDLPTYPITLNFCLETGNDGVMVNTGDYAYLIIYYSD